jgi:hypothetical protein
LEILLRFYNPVSLEIGDYFGKAFISNLVVDSVGLLTIAKGLAGIMGYGLIFCLPDSSNSFAFSEFLVGSNQVGVFDD